MRTLTFVGPLILASLMIFDTGSQAQAQNPIEAAATILWWEGGLRLSLGADAPAPVGSLPVRISGGDAIHLEDGARCWLLDPQEGLVLLESRGIYRYQEGRRVGPDSGRSLSVSGVSVAPPSLWEVVQGQKLTRYGDERAVLLEPVETGVNSVNPSLKWAPPSRREPVVVNLWQLETDGGLRLLETWRTVHGPLIHPWTELERGRTYLWRVRSQGGVEQELWERSAWFYVLPQDQEAHLSKVMSLVDEITQDPTARRGIRASLLTRAGLLGEAEVQWRALALDRPDRTISRRSAGRLGRRLLEGPGSLGLPPLPFDLMRPVMEPSGEKPQ